MSCSLGVGIDHFCLVFKQKSLFKIKVNRAKYILLGCVFYTIANDGQVKCLGKINDWFD